MTISKEKAAYLITLADDNGHINPLRVIDDARDPKSPLHDEFPWDVNEAARLHWLDRARELIRFVKLNVTIHNRTVVAPYYVVDPERQPHTPTRYVELTIAGRNADIAKQIMAAELDRIAAAIRRAQQIADVLGLSDELDQLLEDVTMIKTASERRQEEKRRKVPPKRKPAPRARA